MTKKEEVPSLHGWDLHRLPWENPSGVHLMLHKCRIFSIQRDVRFTHYLFLFIFCLIKTAILLSHLMLGLFY